MSSKKEIITLANDIFTLRDAYRKQKVEETIGDRINVILSTPDSTSVASIRTQWFTGEHERKLPHLRPFKQDEELNDGIRRLICREDSKASLTGLIRNISRALFGSIYCMQKSARDMLSDARFERLWQFALNKRSLTWKDRTELFVLVGQMKERITGNSHVQRRVVSSLDEATILKRMNKLISIRREPSKSNRKLCSTQWMTKNKEGKLSKLFISPYDDTLNERMRELLLLPSSTASLTGVAANLLQVLWKRSDAVHLSPNTAVRDAKFNKVWRFIVKGVTTKVRPEQSIGHALRQIRV